MKFTKKSLLETLRLKAEGKSSYQARREARVSVRRVDQIWKEYLTTGEVPVVGKGVGRPVKPIEQWEKELVKRIYEKYRVSADAIEKFERGDRLDIIKKQGSDNEYRIRIGRDRIILVISTNQH